MDFGSFMHSFGWLIVLLGSFLEGEATLLVSGYAAHQGYLNFFLMVLMAWIGSYLGDGLFFVLGRRKSPQLRNPSTWIGKRMDRLASAAEEYPVATIMFLRFQIAMRMFGCFTLGISAIPTRRFFRINVWACAAWAVVISGLCVFFGRFWDWFFKAMGFLP